MILSKQLFQEKLLAPAQLEQLASYKLLSETGLIHFPYAGMPLFLPIGHLLLKKIKHIIENQLEYHGFSQLYAPLLQHEDHLQRSGRHAAVKQELFYLQQKYAQFYLTPTNEEFFLSLLTGNLSYRHLPLRFFQIADKFRNIKKPKDILRSKQFLMCDAISIDISIEQMQHSAQLFEQTVAAVFNDLGLDYLRCEKNHGAYVDFLILCPEGETKLEKNQQGRFEFSEHSSDYNASSLSMYFIFDCDQLLPSFFTDKDGQKKCVQMGTYGFGLQRCLHAVIHQYRDCLGINFPTAIRPFNVSLLPIDAKSDAQTAAAQALYHLLHKAGLQPLLDDRYSTSLKQRAGFSDYLGVPQKIFIGPQELATQQLSIKTRGLPVSTTINKADLVPYLQRYLQNEAKDAHAYA